VTSSVQSSLGLPAGVLPRVAGTAAAPLRAEPPAPAAVSNEADARAGIRNRTVLIYIALALLALVPGLLGLAKVEFGQETWAGLLHRRLIEALKDIRFGSGLRFWLGVSGATMMGLLLLYPVRKALARRRGLGSVGGWFHLHILMGLFGPVLILYHCNFGHGPRNANVALWSMLVVAVAGIAGHFVYARVSAGFYGDKRRARDHLDALISTVRSLDGLHPAAETLIARLERFEQSMLAPRRGITASLSARISSAVHRHQFHVELKALLAAQAQAQRWSRAQHQQRGRHLHALMKFYMDAVRAAAGRSVLEQLWARWRLFHMPVFLIMVAAVVLHVMAVWGMDKPKELTGAERAPDRIAQILAAPAAIPAPKAESAPTARSGRFVPAQPAEIPTATRAITKSAAPAPSNEDILSRLVGEPREITSPPKRTARAPLVRPAPLARPPVVVAERPAGNPQRSAESMVPAPVTAKEAAIVPKAEAPPTAAPAPAGIEAVYAALRQSAEPLPQPPPPMGLGAPRKGDGSRVLSLTELLAKLKSERFDHNTTRFPLTGKHAKVECASCHTATIENNPRECIACHKKDEPHKGRRPDCAQCHTTNRFTQILRRP
jgi:hypothetical protein